MPSNFVLKTGQIEGDEPMEKSLYDYKDENENWTQSRITVMIPIYNWIIACFFNNLQQAFLQGIYSQSPSMIKTTFEQEFKKEDGNFNTLFNLIPYNEKKEDIGIYLNGYIRNLNLKLYGIKEDNKTQILKYVKGNDLKKQLIKNNNSILINQSLAKRLKLKAGDKVNIAHIINTLNYKDNEVEINNWDTSSLKASTSKDKYTSASNLYKSSIIKDEVNGWKHKTINPTGDNRVYKSKIDITSPSLVGATDMSKNIANANISI